MSKLLFIIQARMTSTRLPNKVMLPLFEKQSVLEVFIQRLSKYKDNIVIATTEDNTSLPIIELCNKLNIKYYKGSMDNVLERYYKCAKHFQSSNEDTIIRICSDSPCIDVNIAERVIKFYKKNKFDYVSNESVNGTPKGLNIEVFSFKMLEKAFLNARTNFQKEHVTPYIKENFYLGQYIHNFNHQKYILTLDTQEDYLYLRSLFKNLNKIDFSYNELITTIENMQNKGIHK